MPGFFIGASSDRQDDVSTGQSNFGGQTLNATIETHRDSRFAVTKFMDLTATGTTSLMYVKDVTMPDKLLKMLSISTISTTYNFASQASYTDLKIIFYTSSKEFIDTLVDLEKEIHTVDDGIKDFNRYKKEIDIIWFKDGGGYDSELPKVRYKCKGCVINKVSWGQVSYGSSSIKLVDVAIKVDVVDIEPNYR